MNLFLDGSREPAEVEDYMSYRIGKDSKIYSNQDWHVVRDFKEFVEWFKLNPTPETISFGHDLAEEHYEIVCACGSSEDFPEEFETETGADCLNWMIEYVNATGLELPKCIVHSMNPYGAEKMRKIIANL